jgi:hypothetical protein
LLPRSGSGQAATPMFRATTPLPTVGGILALGRGASAGEVRISLRVSRRAGPQAPVGVCRRWGRLDDDSDLAVVQAPTCTEPVATTAAAVAIKGPRAAGSGPALHGLGYHHGLVELLSLLG